MPKLQELVRLGHSIWLDYIRRAFITSGELQSLIEDGLRGVTSNPTIFERAIAGSSDYDESLRKLLSEGKSSGELYESLVLDDIARTADLLRPVYDATGGVDGFVSLEVSPSLANDVEGTVAEAHRLVGKLERPNVMIKVPATEAGVEAVRMLVSKGINVNATLIFSLSAYEAVAEAYVSGLEELADSGRAIEKVSSVASFFLSRIDTAVDKQLHERGNKELLGKAAIASAKVAYARFREIFSGPRWENLAVKGARVQRPLWASTGTKNPLYSDTMYVDNLIGPDSVSTLPVNTLYAFRDHGTVAPSVAEGLEEARGDLGRLSEAGIELDRVTETLLKEGLAAFQRSFDSLQAGIEAKCEELRNDRWHMIESLGERRVQVDEALAVLKANEVVARIWKHDHTVWKAEPDEITNRLGWLTTAEVMLENLHWVKKFADQVRAEGFTHALLLGMGGSSLAPEVFRRTFGVKKGCLDLAVLDSTDPEAVLDYADHLDLKKTLFIVSTKSGTTTETLSFYKFFYNLVSDRVGRGKAGKHFVAITDPESPLAAEAARRGFRAVFLNDPNIGGRYSALSYFGIVPAFLIGMDVELLLLRAGTMVCNCEGCNCPVDGDNSGARLGVVMGELAKAGKDKLTLVTSPSIESFGDWVEQLIAESTGKEGKGILPVVGERPAPPPVYGEDRLFVYLRLDADGTHDGAVQALQDAGHPVVRLRLRDEYDLGAQMFLWEMATAVAGHVLGINPFDQPNVEAAKVRAREMIAQYRAEGRLPEDEPASLTPDALERFLSDADPGDYIALQAYVRPSAETWAALQAFRLRLRDQYRLATTLGYGPRFLHSTGQLHKGDAGRGMFIQFTSDPERDAPVPDEAGSAEAALTFGVLKMAAALGDKQALVEAGRRVLRFHLGTEVLEGLRQLAEVPA